MILERSDVVVVGGEVQLLDFVIPRLDLQPVVPTASPVSIFAVLTLGSMGQTLRTQTNAFDATDLEEYESLEAAWKRLHKAGQFDRSLFEYLLTYFCSRSEFKIEFVIEDGRMARFVVKLGRRLTLQGRFPVDVDTLAMYFSPVLSTTD